MLDLLRHFFYTLSVCSFGGKCRLVMTVSMLKMVMEAVKIAMREMSVLGRITTMSEVERRKMK